MAAPIIVISANSNVGSAAVRHLAKAKIPVRAAVRNLAKAESLKPLGVEVVYADMDAPKTLATALNGVETAILATPADPGLPRLHGLFYDAAREQGLRHIVRVSVIGADPGSPLQLGRMHGEAEKALEATGMAWTHLRPVSFMQNFFAQLGPILTQGKIFNCAGKGKIPFVDARDVGALAAACATASGHESKAYDVTGPEAIAYSTVAAKIAERMQRKVEYVNLSPEEAAQGMIANGMPEWLAKDLAMLGQLAAEGKAAQVSSAVRDVTGREPGSFDQFLDDHAHIFSPSPGR
jgi:uncharacterized protein YbjT (DUF2867 family)